MGILMKKLSEFVKKETVLCIAVMLAVLSMFVVVPDKAYIDYIDFRTLALLFCLMAVMEGCKQLGFFEWIAHNLLQRVKGAGVLIAILVFLCFGFGMLITNDVALITFVPFTFIVLKLVESKNRKINPLPVVAMQTIAANLGSMLTPLGNPQNLYLYGKAGLSVPKFMLLMAPYAGTAFAMILIWCILQGRKFPGELSLTLGDKVSLKGKKARLMMYLVLFMLSLLTILHVLPYPVTLIITFMVVLLADCKVLAKVDYSLLITFVGLFIFIGNMGRIPVFYDFLSGIVAGNEVYVAIGVSQFISNVPAALLLSGFTDDFRSLLIGVNLGGMGTLIASMASLISYKLLVAEIPEKKGKYLGYFTLYGICFLVVLVIIYICVGTVC